MNTSSLFKLALATAVTLVAAHTGSTQNVGLVEPSSLVLTPGYPVQSFDTFYAGAAKMTLPEDITQRTTRGLNAARHNFNLPRLSERMLVS